MCEIFHCFLWGFFFFTMTLHPFDMQRRKQNRVLAGSLWLAHCFTAFSSSFYEMGIMQMEYIVPNNGQALFKNFFFIKIVK